MLPIFKATTRMDRSIFPVFMDSTYDTHMILLQKPGKAVGLSNLFVL